MFPAGEGLEEGAIVVLDSGMFGCLQIAAREVYDGMCDLVWGFRRKPIIF